MGRPGDSAAGCSRAPPRVLVSIAGPAAGFAFAGLTLAVASGIGFKVYLGFHAFLPHLMVFPGRAFISAPPLLSLPSWLLLLNDLLWVNFYWG